MAADRQTGKDDEIDLGQLFTTLWKGKWLLAAAMLVGGALGVLQFANTMPIYQADALLQLEARGNSLALPTSMMEALGSSGDASSVTEMEILRSRLVLSRAVAELRMDLVVEPERAPVLGVLLSRFPLPAVLDSYLPVEAARAGEGLQLADLTVPPRWLNTPMELRVLDGNGGFVVTTPDGVRHEGQAGVRLVDEELGFSVLVDEIDSAPGRLYQLEQLDEISAIAALRLRISVSERGRSSGILEVRITGDSPASTSRDLNAVVQSYVAQNISRSAAEAESSLTFIRSQIPQAEANLRAAEAELNAYRQEQSTVDLTLETQSLLGLITRLEADLLELQRREDGIAQRYTESHPTYRQLLEERARIEERLAVLREQAGTLPETQQRILNLSQNLQMAQKTYTELLARSQEVEVLRASTIGNVRIVDDARASLLKIAPRGSMIVAMGLLLGNMVGMALVFLRSWLRKGIHGTDEIEKLGLSVFATVNYSKTGDTRGKRAGAMPLLAVKEPTNLTVEALRSLRTSLHFAMLDAQTPTLAITSPHPTAGKSFLSANLAVVAAQAGQRVCLIDADLRRGQLRRFFSTPKNGPGLVDIITGSSKIEDVAVDGPVPGLSFIATGKYPPNPAELLMRPETKAFLEQCAEKFDLIILDMPPVLAVTDPVILSRISGATLLVTRFDRTLPGELEASLKAYDVGGAKIAGAVLNGFDPRLSKAGYDYGYSYDYRNLKDED
jgi:tyrosine-protein kinase Etk/Wzc